MTNYFNVSDSPDGWRNLALDEYLLDTLKPGAIFLLLYVNESAVIIGKNQNPWAECDLRVMEADGVQLARRCTGGGTVYHDRGNLNYSFIAHKDRYDEKRQTALALNVLRGLGIDAERTGRNDLSARGRKISGTAYCARGENRQQHGTILVSADLARLEKYLTVAPRKLESKGVKSVRSRVLILCEVVPGITVPEVSRAFRDGFFRAYGELQEYLPTPGELTETNRLFERNRSWAWQLGKAPAFDYTYENHFEWAWPGFA